MKHLLCSIRVAVLSAGVLWGAVAVAEPKEPASSDSKPATTKPATTRPKPTKPKPTKPAGGIVDPFG
jgi:hypothetical protein